jgi:endonuclease/exonuclease/phosphatase family metal-dependent hydrolase
MATMRIGTFNCENLFSRARALNLDDKQASAGILARVGALQALLQRDVYDKQAILAMYSELKDYIEIRQDSGRFWKGQGNKEISANGRGDWKGSIEFRRADLRQSAREATAQVIRDTRANILCLCEVEGNEILEDFNRQMLGADLFDQHLLIDSPNDPRGIDVGLFLRGTQLREIRTHVFDPVPGAPGRRVFSRDCLRVAVAVPGLEQPVHVLLNHFKSKGGGSTKQDADARRLGQATRVREIVKTEYDLSRDLVVILGDLNDTPESTPLAPLFTTPGLHDAVALGIQNSADRWTHYFGGEVKARRHSQLDHILVSAALKPRLRSVEILRRGMGAVATGEAQGDIVPYSVIKTPRDAASDHAAVVAEFQF